MSGPDVAGLIDRLGAASLEAKQQISELHAATKDARQAKRELEELMRKTTKKEVDERVGQLVKDELDKLAPKMREFSTGIYTRIGAEVDRLIDLALGEEFARENKRSSVRPQLAAHIKQWLKEQIDPKLVQPELLLDVDEVMLDFECTCPHCDAPTNMVIAADGEAYKPALGAFTVCSKCAGVAVWALNGWRKPTDQELAEAMTHPELGRAIDKILQLRERDND